MVLTYSNIFFKILIAVLIFLFANIIAPLIAYILIRMFNLKEKNKDKIKKNAFYKPIKIIIVLISLYLISYMFYIPSNIKLILIKIFKICIILAIADGLSNIFNTNSDSFKKIREKINTNGNDSVINFSSKIIKILIYIFAGFIIVSEFGYNLGGLITGLGISSAVIALAAQDLAKSLIGGFSIMIDKPFAIGDYIRINNYEGTVEEINFRSTRIRNLAKELIVIPNNKIADNLVVNFSKRNVRQYKNTLVLELSTPLEKITEFKEKLLILIDKNDNILKEDIRIYFDVISDNGFNLEISFYTTVLDYNEFLQFKENMNFEIMNLLQNEQIELAYDSKTVYLKQ